MIADDLTPRFAGSDFTGNTMPTQLDKVSATLNGKSAYVYYVSTAQIDILTPPDTISGAVQVVVTNHGTATAAFTAQAQPISPSFFVLGEDLMWLRNTQAGA